MYVCGYKTLTQTRDGLGERKHSRRRNPGEDGFLRCFYPRSGRFGPAAGVDRGQVTPPGGVTGVFFDESPQEEGRPLDRDRDTCASLVRCPRTAAIRKTVKPHQPDQSDPAPTSQGPEHFDFVRAHYLALATPSSPLIARYLGPRVSCRRPLRYLVLIDAS